MEKTKINNQEHKFEKKKKTQWEFLGITPWVS